MSQYPYAQPLVGLDKIISHLRKTTLKSVTANTLKKLAIAPNNESYIINTLRFIGVVDTEGNTVSSNMESFLKTDEGFCEGFSKMLENSYKGLFDIFGDSGWMESKDRLAGFFRTEDKSSLLVGNRQADTFIRLAGIAGKREMVNLRSNSSKPKNSKQQSANKKDTLVNTRVVNSKQNIDETLNLSVKIEVNLPPTSDQAVYDAIFKSIRQQLIDHE